MWILYLAVVVLLVCGYRCHGYQPYVNRFHDISMNSVPDTGKEKFKVVTPDKIASLFPTRNSKPSSIGQSSAAINIPKTDNSLNMTDQWTVLLLETVAETNVASSNSTDDYNIFGQPLNVMQQKQVSQALSMGGRSSSSLATLPRAVSSATTDRTSNRYRGYNPMSFGAYRRFRETGGSGGRTSTSNGGGSRGKRKKKGGMSADSFYDAIRKLGSGPVDKGTTSRTGVVEPPPGQKPIQPKKAPMKGSNRRRIITPDDIRSLFTSKPDNKKANQGSSYNEDPLADYDDYEGSDEVDVDNDGGYDEGNRDSDDNRNKAALRRGDSSAVPPARQRRRSDPTALSSSTDLDTTGSTTGSTADSAANSGGDIPQWLRDADKQGRLRRTRGSRKPKPLLKDWRFWAAGILAVGFAAAFANMYHITGGFGTLDSPIADKFNEM